jgi:hypothetical protein
VNNATTTPADTILPTVAITAPATGSTVSGTSTTIAIDATDNVAVTGVKLMLDGTIVGAELTAAPYTFVWDTTTATNGTHALTAEARDAAGNIGTSTAVTVAVNNATTTQDTTAPTVAITSPADGAVITGENTVTVSATDNVGVVGVTLLFDGEIAGGEATSAPYAFGWNSLGVTNGTHTIAALARDAAGNTATSTPVGINVTN